MDQEREDNRIKELFHEVKQADERRAPAFACMMEAARLRTEKTRQPWRLLPIAAAAVMLVLVGGSVFVIHRQVSTKTTSTERPEMEAPIALSRPPDITTIDPHKDELIDKKLSPRSIRRRGARQTKRSSTLISEWRSPTGFLLETSGQQLLRTTPRLGESIATIEGFVLKEKN